MKKIKLSNTDIATGKKISITIPVGVKQSLGLIPFSFIRADSNIITRTSLFFVFDDDSVGVSEPLQVISNPTPSYYNLNTSIDGRMNFTCVNRELFIENRTTIPRPITVMIY